MVLEAGLLLLILRRDDHTFHSSSHRVGSSCQPVSCSVPGIIFSHQQIFFAVHPQVVSPRGMDALGRGANFSDPG